MNDATRRDVLKAGLAAGATLAAGPVAAMAGGEPMGQAKKFKQKYAPHFGMFKNSAPGGWENELKFAADEGFTAWEDNGMKGWTPADQDKFGKTMTRLGMTMGVFVANDIDWSTPSLTTGKQDILDKFLRNIKDSVDVAKRVNAKWMTVVPGVVQPRLEPGYQTANVVDALRRASEILEPHGLVMVLEPLNFRDHPNLFLTKVAQTYLVCKAVNSPSCKILFDLYHQQVQEGNLIPNLDLAWSEAGYIQIGDNPGRNEPTTGEINYRNVFGHIASKGYKGVLGMEHGNSKPGKDGERALINAYRAVDG